MSKRTQLEACIEGDDREVKRSTPQPTYTPPTHVQPTCYAPPIQVPQGYYAPPSYAPPPGYYAPPTYVPPPMYYLPPRYGAPTFAAPTNGHTTHAPAMYAPPTYAPPPDAHPPAAFSTYTYTYETSASAPQPPAIVTDTDFSSLYSSVLDALYPDYEGSGTEEFENSFDAAEDIKQAIGSIRTICTQAQVTFGTKRNALITLRKIGDCLVQGSDTLGSEVRKRFQYDDCLEEAMIEILRNMTVIEMRTVALSDDEKGVFVDNMRILRNLAKEYCVFDQMNDVVVLLIAAVNVLEKADVDDEGGTRYDDEGESHREVDDVENDEDDEEDEGD